MVLITPTPTLRIALFTYSTKPRGSVVHTLELAIALHTLGHTVCIYALAKDSTGFDRPLPCQVDLIPAQSAPPEMDQLIHQRVQEFVDGLSDRWQQGQLNHDIFHAQDCLSANALTELRKRHGSQSLSPAPDGSSQKLQHPVIPHLIRTVHHIETYTSPYLRACQDRSIREADLCVCVSQHWQQQLKTHYGIEPPRVTNGINTQRFTPPTNAHLQAIATLKHRLGIQSGAFVYLTVGGIEPRKNSIRLLQAFAQALSHHPQAQLVIAGGATLFDYHTYRDKFFAEVERLKIPIGISLLLPGVLSNDDLACLYRAADAFVFPSVKEGWGMVVVEAIASGLPVIVPQQAPFTEFLRLDQALWVNPYDGDTITQAMLEVIKPHVHNPLVANSQELLTQYTWERSAQLHVSAYMKIMVG